MAVLIVLANLAIGAALLGIAYFMNWAGPGYALGVMTGMMLFASWIRITDGKWP